MGFDDNRINNLRNFFYFFIDRWMIVESVKFRVDDQGLDSDTIHQTVPQI
jgi:hypothetical protein